MKKVLRSFMFVWLALLCTGTASAEMESVLAELETYATQTMTEQGIPGMAYAVIKDDQVVFAKGFGVRELGKPDPVDAHTVFEIGSTSKAFTVALLAMLDDAGQLSWEDKVTQHWPGFAMYDPWVTREFTIADLVSQRSGMPPYAIDAMSFIGFNRNQIARAVRHVEPITSFRSTFGYVNNLFLVASRVIEHKTGLPWEDALDASILGPLGMTETTAHSEIAATWQNMARGYINCSDGSLWPIPQNWIYADWIDTYGPAGGIRSTVLDLAKWVRLQLGKGAFEGQTLISKENIAAMHQPKIFASDAAFGGLACYASGWLYNVLSPHVLVWHNGTTTGMHSIVGFVPEANVGLVVLTNTSANTLPEKMLLKFYQLYFNTPAATPLLSPAQGPGSFLATRAKAPQAPPTLQEHLPFDRYCGTYAHPAYGRMSVQVIDNALYAILGPNRIKARLRPYSGNTFTLAFPQFPDMGSLTTFVVKPGEKAEQIVVELFDDSNGGRYTRVSD